MFKGLHTLKMIHYYHVPQIQCFKTNPSNAHMDTSGILSINTMICFGLSAQPHTELTIYDENIKGLIQFLFYIKQVLY